MRARVLALGWLVLLPLALQVAGCWALAGVEDREAMPDVADIEPAPGSCPSPFVSSVTAECATCLETSCCDALRDCTINEDCRACVAGESSFAACGEVATVVALRSCVGGQCDATCRPGGEPIQGLPTPDCEHPPGLPSGGRCFQKGDLAGRIQCNPLSNDPCDGAAGEACALDPGLDAWHCSATGHHQPTCAPCGLLDGGCAPGHVCLDGACYRYCCDESDCGTGVCFYVAPHPFSVCVTRPAPP